jgi:epoxyqueuosine reductase
METFNGIKNPADWLETTIKDFINKSPENTLQNRENEKAWADPLIGFSRGDDPLYQEYKEKIGNFYWTPWEIFNKTFPGLAVEPDQLTIISWILPQVEATKSDNRNQTVYPAERWSRARFYGEEVNVKLRDYVVTTLQGSGYRAVAPMNSPLWERKTSERYGLASTWSERHAAYTSGLGTFSLSDGLITPKGKAIRCGSVVAHIKIPPTNRPYRDHLAYCLFFSKGICGKCIHRCPVGAITEEGHDKTKCFEYLSGAVADYARSHFEFGPYPYGCGLCQTNVPCESKIPMEKDLQ